MYIIIYLLLFTVSLGMQKQGTGEITGINLSGIRETKLVISHLHYHSLVCIINIQLNSLKQDDQDTTNKDKVSIQGNLITRWQYSVVEVLSGLVALTVEQDVKPQL